MKIVIVSDSHGNKEVLEKVVLMNQNADLFLHAGDSGLSVFELHPFISVRGNCDYDHNLLNDLIVATPYGKLYLIHGHQSPLSIKYKMEEENIKILVTGHTHIKRSELIDGIYLFNPGSICLPRDSSDGSYLILEISDKDVKYIFNYL